MAVEPRAGLEQLERRTRKWHPVELTDGMLRPGPRDVFRTGDLVFRLEVD